MDGSALAGDDAVEGLTEPAGLGEHKGLRVNLANVEWRKSTRGGDNCVEVAFVGDAIAVRDARKPEVVLVFNRGEWDSFVGGAKDGEFDL